LPRHASADGPVPAGSVELTILMPCLNEAETLATCIAKAKGYLARSGVSGEVLIADNGSTDGSQEIAVPSARGSWTWSARATARRCSAASSRPAAATW
jgi:GT2 family glycosyltransferase